MFGKEMAIHRLTGVTEKRAYIFQGDNNEKADRIVSREQKEKFTFVLPYSVVR